MRRSHVPVHSPNAFSVGIVVAVASVLAFVVCSCFVCVGAVVHHVTRVTEAGVTVVARYCDGASHDTSRPDDDFV